MTTSAAIMNSYNQAALTCRIVFGKKQEASESGCPMDEKQNDMVLSKLDEGEEVVMDILPEER